MELAKHIASNCPNLEFCGLMTIGMPDYTSTPENFKVVLLKVMNVDALYFYDLSILAIC